MTTYKIIHTTLNDLDFCCALFVSAIAYQKKNGYPAYRTDERALIQRKIEENEHFKLVVNDEIAMVFSICYSDALIWEERDQIPAIYLHHVLVNPNHKGQKHFEKVCAWARTKALNEGIAFLRLDTWADNPDLENYYLQFGFKTISVFDTPDRADVPVNCRGNRVVLMEYKI